jgi:hypothetical protein
MTAKNIIFVKLIRNHLKQINYEKNIFIACCGTLAASGGSRTKRCACLRC